MNTKYIKVPTTERLPEKFGHFMTFNIDNQQGYNYFDDYDNEFRSDNDREIEFWLEEIPDREEEMRELLEDLIGYEDRCRAKGDPAIGDGWYNKAKQLLNKQ